MLTGWRVWMESGGVHILMRRQLHSVGSCRNSFGSQSLACAGSTRDATMSCIADGARDAGSVMQTNNRLRSHVDLGQRPAFEGFFEGNPTLARFALRSLRMRQTAWRQHGGIMEASCRQQMFQTYEQTNPPLLLFWCARAEARLALRPHVWEVARSSRLQRDCIVRVCRAHRSGAGC